MEKMAFFVEGKTEALLIKNLIEKIATANSFAIEHKKISGGATIPRSIETIEAAVLQGNERYFFLIFDCGGDHQVKTRILEEHARLTASGYKKIVGIRDVYPDFLATEINALRLGLRTYIKTSLAPVEFILSTMEVEAWFLAEINHFKKIDPALTMTSIAAALGFNPSTDDMTARPAPAKDLDACYKLVGKVYEKAGALTLQALDFDHMYLSLGDKVEQLAQLVESIDDFLGIAKQTEPQLVA
jgi:hypothetical protein